jgi:formylglycine-generating enzyme required for sulfatase activity
MSDIFISYASKDRHCAEVVANALEQQGWTVWWDPEIVPGKRFDQVIEEELEKARCIVVLWSSSSIASHWVTTEANEGVGRKILVPALIEDNVTIPLAFRIIEAARLTGWLRQKGSPRDREFDRFVKAIAEKIGRPEDLPSSSESSPSPEPHPESRWRKSAFLLVVIFIAAAWFLVAPRREIPQGEKESIALEEQRKKEAEEAERKAKEEAERRAAEQQRKHEEEQRRTGEMVRVPAGDFFMGCNEKVDTECDSDEKSGRTMNLPAFTIDKTEVTVAQYQTCVEAGKCTRPGTGGSCNWDVSGRKEHPINCVDWNQAQAFCAWAGKRLPSEAEWEKAARGTDGRKYPWGNKGYGEAGKVANIADETAKKQNSGMSWALEGYNDGFYETAPVGSFPAGESLYHALDMIGNVWEWTADWYDGEKKYRSVRGGSWLDRPRLARASYRLRDVPGYRDVSLGFRCAQ